MLPVFTTFCNNENLYLKNFTWATSLKSCEYTLLGLIIIMIFAETRCRTFFLIKNFQQFCVQ